MQRYIAEESQVWERAYIRKTEAKIKGSYRVWGDFGKWVIELLSFTEGKKNPHILSSDYNLHSGTYCHWKKKTLSQRHVAVAKPCDPFKNQNKIISSGLVLLSVPAGESPLPMIGSSGAHRGNVFTDRQLAWTGSARASTINTKRDKTDQCDAHRLSWC